MHRRVGAGGTSGFIPPDWRGSRLVP
jgi:hypothetical protein